MSDLIEKIADHSSSIQRIEDDIQKLEQLKELDLHRELVTLKGIPVAIHDQDAFKRDIEKNIESSKSYIAAIKKALKYCLEEL